MEHILGQTRAIALLQAALKSDRLHHAYIFHGPAGVGKFTTALAFAEVLLCHDRQTDLSGGVGACGSCPSCKLLRHTQGRVVGAESAKPRLHATKDFRGVEDSAPATQADGASASGHPDLHVVTKELARHHEEKTIRERKLLTIPYEVLRDNLIEPVYRSAQMRHGKVFIVDEAELIDPRGQNILLKALEEPPAGTVLILITPSEDRLLPTIRSRCQRIAFTPLPAAVVGAWLAKHEKNLGERERRWLADFAAGSLGRAELVVRYDLLTWPAAVLPALEQMRKGAYPVGLGQEMAKLINGFAERWVKEHENASKEAANKQAAGLMWSMIGQWVGQRLTEAAASAKGNDPADAEAAVEPWLAALRALGDAERDLAANLNLAQVCDHLVSVLAARHSQMAIS